MVAVDMLVGVRPSLCAETYLYFLLMTGCLSLDHFFHPVDHEVAQMLELTPAKGQVRAGWDRCPILA